MGIERVAVLGAGVMGGGIAAHLANAGMQVLLLDVVPKEPTEAERNAGLGLGDRVVRDRLAAGALGAMKKSKAGLFLPALAAQVEIGNLDDDLARLADCDWVIEVVLEDLAVKRELLGRRVAPHLRADAILSSNTSGLSVEAMAEALPPALRRRFLVTHFFNPPRHMRLVEVVPSTHTDPAVVATVERLLDQRLGKGVVRAKDTPNFIANRIGVFSLLDGMHHLVDLGMTVEEVDAVAGPATARPRSGIFRTADLVGVDTLVRVADNTHALLPGDEARATFVAPELVRGMVARGLTGDKARQGFYRKGKDGSVAFLDLRSGEYVPSRAPRFASVEATRGLADPAERVRAVLAGSDPAAEFAWRNLRDTLLYAYRRVPEIADDVVAIDRAMRWGFNWELGPFELLDAIAVPAFVARAERDGVAIPEGLRKIERFYTGQPARREALDATGTFRPIPRQDGVVDLAAIRAAGGVVEENRGASLLDLGDGVLLVEFHTKANAISDEVLAMILRGVERAEREWRALVLGNAGPIFSAGADLAGVSRAVAAKDFAAIEGTVRTFQRATMALKTAKVPVVAAPHGMALAGGCELCLHATAVNAHAETSMGLVEVGVGILPAAGGTKELALRAIQLADDHELDPLPFVAKAFETIVTARVSGSAAELREMGLLRDRDGWTMNAERVLGDARLRAVALAANHRPALAAREVKAPGRGVAASLHARLWNLRAGGFISEHDERIGKVVAGVLTGGDVAAGTTVNEQWLLDLELEGILSLLGEPKTQVRITHMLETGKPLRN